VSNELDHYMDKENVNANVFEMEEFGNHLMVRPI
jgi:hypothetical protein